MTGSCVLREMILRVVRGWFARFVVLSLPPPAHPRELLEFELRMPQAATTSDATGSPPVPRDLQHDGRALVRLVTNAAADLAHIGLVLFLVACSLVRKVHCTALHRTAPHCATYTACTRPRTQAAVV